MRQIVTSVMAVLFAMAAYGGTIVDDFGDGNAQGWRERKEDKVVWTVSAGRLVSTSEVVCEVPRGLAIGDNTWTDYTFEVDFQIDEPDPFPCERSKAGSALFIGVHGDTENRGAGLDMWWWLLDQARDWDENGCRKALPGGGFGIDLGEQPQEVFEIKEGKWYKAKIVAEGEHYEMFLDGDKVCEFDAASPSKGPAYLAARNGTYFFDNVKITGDTISDLNLSVSPQGKIATVWAGLKLGVAL